MVEKGEEQEDEVEERITRLVQGAGEWQRGGGEGRGMEKGTWGEGTEGGQRGHQEHESVRERTSARRARGQ